MKDSLIKGVKCPYANIQPELNECKYSNLENSLFYFITPEQMMELNIVDSATTNADPQLLKIEEIEKLRSEMIDWFMFIIEPSHFVLKILQLRMDRRSR